MEIALLSDLWPDLGKICDFAENSFAMIAESEEFLYSHLPGVIIAGFLNKGLSIKLVGNLTLTKLRNLHGFHFRIRRKCILHLYKDHDCCGKIQCCRGKNNKIPMKIFPSGRTLTLTCGLCLIDI